MIATSDTWNGLEELAYRENDGIEVALLWNRDEDSLVVAAFGVRTGEALMLAASPDEALEVFYHPYAYAESRAIGTRTSSPSVPVAA